MEAPGDWSFPFLLPLTILAVKSAAPSDMSVVSCLLFSGTVG
jgi:hypothetical protein